MLGGAFYMIIRLYWVVNDAVYVVLKEGTVIV